MCVCVCQSVCAHECSCSWRSEESIGSPEARVTRACELPLVTAGNQQVGFSARAVHTATAKPSLQPLFIYNIFYSLKISHIYLESVYTHRHTHTHTHTSAHCLCIPSTHVSRRSVLFQFDAHQVSQCCLDADRGASFTGARAACQRSHQRKMTLPHHL